jgi:hypothetical protein
MTWMRSTAHPVLARGVAGARAGLPESVRASERMSACTHRMDAMSRLRQTGSGTHLTGR